MHADAGTSTAGRPDAQRSSSRVAEAAGPGAGTRGRPGDRPRGMLAQLRIRKKLILLHTVFSVLLAGLLLAVLRPTVDAVVKGSEYGYAASVFERARAGGTDAEWVDAGGAAIVRVVYGDRERLGIPGSVSAEIDAAEPGRPVRWRGAGRTGAVGLGRGTDLVAVWVTMPEVRRVAVGVFVFVAVALVVVYASVAAALEVFVLPRHVYGPIRRMLAADRAVQAGQGDRELIPERYIPADELGEIMRSRNASIVALRQKERQLGSALGELEHVANDLRRKNHLLENAKRNLADTDRLASLGVMSAGIAHEMNTPLSVAKGLVDKLARVGSDGAPSPGLSEAEVGLLSRVVGRLERVSESLLDFARVRPPELTEGDARSMVDEAVALVGLDRVRPGAGTGRGAVRLVNAVPGGLALRCDTDRVIQVLVNLIRNGVDAASGADRAGASVSVTAEAVVRDGDRWVSVIVRDTGPGIDPEVLPMLFEPFVSTRLDAQGTGLGLAVSQGIAQEHGGVILARNVTGPDGLVTGAEFEVLLPDHRDIGSRAGRGGAARGRALDEMVDRAGDERDGPGSASGGTVVTRGPGEEDPGEEDT